ncbi:MAG TPA: TolC family protein [Vicinamibacterales bacterium]|nr:TolC family protein [Vicinamibacterales bacterium]
MNKPRVSIGVITFVAALAAALAASAQTTSQDVLHQHGDEARGSVGPPLSLADAIAEALSKNPDLLALRAQLPVTRARPAQERALMPPMVEAQIWQWPINTLNPANVNMYMFMVDQDLPGRGKRRLHAAVAQKDVALAESDVAIRSRLLVNEVKQAYSALFIGRKAIDVHLASVDLLRQVADVSQVKYATGRISQQDILKPVTEISKHHSDIVMFEEQARIAAARLNILLDRAPDAPIGPLAEPVEQTLLPASGDMQRLAIEHQPELRKAAIEVERAEAELASARQDYKPDFSLQGGYQVMPNQTDAWLARVGITWPKAPWSRGKIDARVAEQIAAVSAAKARERAMENNIRLAVQEALVRAQSAQQRAALARTTILPQAKQTFDVSRVAYQADRIDFQTVLDNQRMLLDSELDYYKALSDFEQALADLERAIGTDLPSGTTQPATKGELR